MRSSKRILITLLAAALTLAAQSPGTPIGGPVVGLVVDSNSRLRPVLGVPGSASLGAPIPLDSALRLAAVSPRQNYALAFRGDSRELVIIRDPLGVPAVTAISGAAGGIHVSLSPTGSSAAVQSADGQSAQVVSGLPASAATAFQADLSVLPGAVAGLAVSDDGRNLLAASPDGDHVSIFLITPDAGARVIASVGRFSGMAFLPARNDALLIDAQTNQANILRDVAGSSTVALLADGSTWDSRMVDIAGSEDGSVIFIANTDSVLVIDSVSGSQRVIGCDCAPALLSRLSRSPVFLLTDPASGLFWILDGGGANPRIVAIPPDPASAEVTQ